MMITVAQFVSVCRAVRHMNSWKLNLERKICRLKKSELYVCL